MFFFYQYHFFDNKEKPARTIALPEIEQAFPFYLNARVRKINAFLYNETRMEKNMLWKGLLTNSLENALISKNANGLKVSSTVVGHYQDKVFQVDYSIESNPTWMTTSFKIYTRHSNRFQHDFLQRDQHGVWWSKGERVPQFADCIDIDISATPLTNTLPLNRLRLSIGQSSVVKVVYIDVFELTMRPAWQKYTRLTERTYRYENVPNDFEAVITVDDLGFVVDYPNLYTRTASVDAHYEQDNPIHNDR